MTHGDLTGRTLGEFVLEERLGEGGHGIVYRARQPALGRHVVIKVLRAQRRDSPVAQERFLREAQLASLLDHPYAAHIYAFGVDEPDGLLWIAMELVHGVTLQEWFTARGPMPLDQLVPFVEHVAQVVHAAHQHGIVHRDLKPSNMMVIEQGGSLFPKLLDFGIAKAPQDIASISLSSNASQADDPERARGKRGTAQQWGPRRVERVTVTSPAAAASDHHGPLTRPGSGIGSSAYMSPEQWRDAWSVGPASDIYALGVIIYRALAGEDPFIGEHTADYYRQHRDAQPPRLGGELAPVDRVIQRALSKSPDERHVTALDLAADLRAALRASEREQLRTAAQQWDDRRRSPGLLWGREELPDLARWARAPGLLSPLECSFVAASQRRARRGMWLRRSLGLVVVGTLVSALLYHSTMRARIAEATAAQAELEQGRSALLHGEPEAPTHLTVAYEHDHASSTAFMLARALEPRLAEQAQFASSFGRMWSAAFSPDGRQIITTDDLNAQLWDAQTHRLLFKLKHGDVVYHAVYDAGGTRLVTGCGDGAVRVWDPISGALLHELRSRDPGIRYYAVALSPDEQLVAGLGLDPGVAHVWDVRTGRLIADLRDDAGSSFPSLAFSADGRWLAMSTGNDVSVFDTQTWNRTGPIAGRGIHSLSWDPTGPRLLTGGAKGDVSLWNVPGGDRVHRLRESGEAVDAIAFAASGRLIAAGSRSGDELVWDATSAELVSQSNLRSKILSIEFDRTASLVVTGSSNGFVNVNDVASGMPVTVLAGPTAVVRTAHFDPSSTRIVGASWDGTARVWNATAPYRRWASPPVADDCGLVTSLEPDRRFLAISCKAQPTRVWDTARDRPVAELPSVTPAGVGLASAYATVSVSGDRAAIARGEVVEVYELPSARLLRKIRHGAPVTAVAFAADGRDIVSGAADGSLIVTRDNGTRIELPTSSASVDVVGFLAGNRVVEVDADRHLRIYDIGGSRLADLEVRARVAMLRMSADGRRLITASTFIGKVVAPELWDVERYRPIAQLASEGQGQVYSARFVAGGQAITACGDGAARLWDGEAGQLRRTYHGGSRFLADATLTTDGSMVIAGGGGGQLRFWETASGRPLWTMPAHRSDLVGVHVEGDDIVTRGFSGEVARWSLPAAGQVIEACARRERCAIVPP